MKLLPDWIKNGYLRLIDPVANWLVKRGVHPNTITVIGTSAPSSAASSTRPATSGRAAGSSGSRRCSTCSMARSRAARTRARTFGAFLDSTLDRLADGFVLGGLAVFYATSRLHGSVPHGRRRAARAHRHVPHLVHARARRGARHRREGRDAAAPGASRAPVGPAGVLRPRVRRLGARRSSSSF